MRRLALVVLTAATAVVCLTVGAAAAAPLPVVVSSANDIKADRAGSDLIFSQSRHGKPSSYDAFLKRGSAARIKLNLLGNGYAGGINNGRIVYQQVASGDSGLRVYSIGAGTRSTPRVLNSLAWDFAPAIQGNLVLFGRRNFSLRPETDKILLADLGTAKSMVLAESTGMPDRDLFPGRVEGDYAVWTQCTPVAKLCSVFRHRISTQETIRVPQPVPGKINYAGAVTSNGDVYYARGAWGCGANVQLRRYSGAGDALIWQMNPGVDLETTTATWVSPAGAVHFMFSRTPCGSAPRWDIYEVIDP